MGPDQAEGVARGGINAIVVGGVSLSALLKFREAGVKVLLANEGTAAKSLKPFVSGNLRKIGIDQFARLRKKKQRR